MNEVIGAYKDFVIIERDALNELQKKGEQTLSDGQDNHDKTLIAKGKTILECVEYLKKWNIYNNNFKIKG